MIGLQRSNTFRRVASYPHFPYVQDSQNCTEPYHYLSMRAFECFLNVLAIEIFSRWTYDPVPLRIDINSILIASDQITFFHYSIVQSLYFIAQYIDSKYSQLVIQVFQIQHS